jgi:hypothetical protein
MFHGDEKTHFSLFFGDYSKPWVGIFNHGTNVGEKLYTLS